MKKGIIIIFLISFLLSSFSTLKKTYQTSLWTYKNWRKHEIPIKDINISNNKKIDEFKKWNRIRFGLISKPITLDYQAENGIVQIRIELYYLLVNNLVIALGLSILYFGINKMITAKCQ